MRRGENPSVVLERVRAAVGQIDARLASEATVSEPVRVAPFYDRTELVGTTLTTVGHNLLEGGLLVTCVLFVFLLDLRAAMVVAVLIPLSLLTSFIYLQSRGMSANLLSMGAVDFGVIVDGGVVIIESILTHLARGPGIQPAGATELSVEERIRRATRVVVRPTVFALLIIIAAYLPIFMLERVEGRIFAPMANTVVSALAGALLFSVTLVPVLASFVYRGPIAQRQSPVLRWAARAYEPSLSFALRKPLVPLAGAALMLAVAGWMLPRLGSEFLPELNEGALWLTFTLPSNASLSEGRELAPRLLKLIAGNPQVESVISQLGRPEDGTDAKLPNNLEVLVRLKPRDQWPKETRTLSDVIAAVDRSLQ